MSVEESGGYDAELVVAGSNRRNTERSRGIRCRGGDHLIRGLQLDPRIGNERARRVGDAAIERRLRESSRAEQQADRNQAKHGGPLQKTCPELCYGLAVEQNGRAALLVA